MAYSLAHYRDRTHPYLCVSTQGRPNGVGEMKATSTATKGGPRLDPSRQHHIFVGDLSPELQGQHLLDAFRAYESVLEAKVISDPKTNRSKGYGFVTFGEKNDAEAAIKDMNGCTIGARPVRVNWASRKATSEKQPVQVSYEQVLSQSGPTNSTVYVGGISDGLTEELLSSTFKCFGSISDVRVFKDKGYGFVRFGKKEDAATAITTINGTTINGQVVRCSWGREPNGHSQQSVVMLGQGAGNPVYGSGVVYPSVYSTPQQYVETPSVGTWPATVAYPAASYHQPYGYVPSMQWPQQMNQISLQQMMQTNPAAHISLQHLSQPHPGTQISLQQLSQAQPGAQIGTQQVTQPQPATQMSAQQMTQPHPIVQIAAQQIGQPQFSQQPGVVSYASMQPGYPGP